MKHYLLACFLFLGLILSSCVSAPPKNPLLPAPKDAHKELNQVQMDVATGGETKAIGRLKKLIAQHPNTDVADDASMILAKIYYKAQDFSGAYQAYMGIIDSNTLSPNEADALLGASRSLSKLGRPDEALSLSTRGLRIPGISNNLRIEFQKHRYSLLAALGDRIDALRALSDIYQIDNRVETRANVQARASDLINRSLSLDELSVVSSSNEFSFMRPQAAFRLGLLMMAQKDYDSARKAFSKASELAAGTSLDQQAQSYIQQIDSRRRVDPFTIGAVLPLSGRHAPIAQKTLKGLQLGLGIYGDKKSSFKLAVVDSEGSPEGARRAVERLVTEDSAMAIVGSLLSRTATAVAQKADELGVPSIALSQKAGITSVGSSVFRNAVTSEMQVKYLVKVAMDELGYKRFAILFPNDAYGVEYANLFWDEVKARGGTIAAAQPYSSTETDFRAPIRRLIGTYYLEDRMSEYKARLRDWYGKQKTISGRTTPPDDLLPPVIDFDAIFIPDSPKAMGQIAPMLPYQGITKVKLLGTNIWNSNEFLRRGQQNIEGALFVDAPLSSDPKFKSSRFFEDYKRTFGEEPGMFETQGYEAGLLLRQMIEQGQRSRLGLAQALSQVQQIEGVSGPMQMTSQRELVRPLQPLVVKGGAIIPWDMDVEKSLAEPPKPTSASAAKAPTGSASPAAKPAPKATKRPTLKK